MTRNQLTLALLAAAAPLSPAAAQNLLWTRQVGTAWSEWGVGAAVDGAGNAYITGFTTGSLFGRNPDPTGFYEDIFLAKYDASGTRLWTRQAGTPTDDQGWAVAVDGAGNAYITGFTTGSLGGPYAGGFHDAFLAKYDASGTRLWTRQFGTPGDDYGTVVAVDGAGNAFVTGFNAGCFLAKYDTSGALLWTRQIGADESWGVAVDSAGNAYIIGFSAGISLIKFDTSGTLLWTRLFGTSSYERGTGVAVDGVGNAYVTGYTYGSLGGPNTDPTGNTGDVFLAKSDSSGTLLWVHQVGTPQDDYGRGVAVDGTGNAYITGRTYGNLFGPSAGGVDYFLAKYDASGALLWTGQAGTQWTDWGIGVAADGAGNAYVTGLTYGSLDGPNAGPTGTTDVFLAKYGPLPCPADYNRDGFMDGIDYDLFNFDFESYNPLQQMHADLNGDGFVDGLDYDLFNYYFELGC